MAACVPSTFRCSHVAHMTMVAVSGEPGGTRLQYIEQHKNHINYSVI